MDELFWAAWPCVSQWLREQREHALCKWRSRKLLSAAWNAWVDEAAIFPPPLASDSDSEFMPGATYGRVLADESSEDSDDDDASRNAQPFYLPGGPATAQHIRNLHYQLLQMILHREHLLHEMVPRSTGTSSSATSLAAHLGPSSSPTTLDSPRIVSIGQESPDNVLNDETVPFECFLLQSYLLCCDEE